MAGGQTGSDVRIAIKGRVLTAPVGTSAPGDVASAWGAGWSDHGFVDPAGAVVTPSITSYDVKAWQSDTAIRTRIVERMREIKVILVQLGALNTVLYNGGGTITQIPTRSVSDAVLNGTTTVTSATAVFVAGDVGATIVGTGIPLGATITVRNSATSVTISAAATLSATGVTITIGAPGTYQYSAPSPGTDDTRMLGIEWTDGTVTKREIYPQAIVINVDPYALTSAKEVQLGVTWRCNTDGWYYISNDPIDAPGTLVA